MFASYTMMQTFSFYHNRSEPLMPTCIIRSRLPHPLLPRLGEGAFGVECQAVCTGLNRRGLHRLRGRRLRILLRPVLDTEKDIGFFCLNGLACETLFGRG